MNNFFNFYDLLKPGYFNQFIHNLLDNLFNFNKHILLNLDFEGSVLVNQHFHFSLNFSNDIPDHFFFNYFFNNLRDFDDFFNNSGNDDYFLNNLLNLDDLRHFDHLLNNLVYFHPHLFDPVDNSGDLHNFLFYVLEWFGNFDEMINNLFDFHNFGFLDDQRISQVDLFDNSVLYPLNYRFLDKFSHCNEPFMDDRHLDNFFNFPRHFSNHLHDLSDYFLNNLNLLLDYYLFSNHFDFLHSSFSVDDLHYFLNKLRHFHNSFNSLNDGHWLLHNSFDYFVLDFNMVENFSGISILHNRDQFLHYFFNFDYFGHFDDPLNDFLNYDRDLNNFLYYFLDWYDLFLDDLHLLILFLNMIHDSLNLHYFFHFDNLLFEFLYLHDFGHFSFHFDKLLHNCWHLYNPFNDVFKRYYFLDHTIIDDRLLQRHVYYSINLFYFFDFDNLFNNPIDCDYLRNLDKLLHDFFHNLLHLNNFGHHSEYFENIIDVDNSHDLLPDHTHDSLIHFRD